MMSSFFSISSWFFGIIFIGVGLSFLFNEVSLFLSMVVLIGATLLLPPIKQLIQKKEPTFSKGKITILGTILTFIPMFFLPTVDNDYYKQLDKSDEIIHDQVARIDEEDSFESPSTKGFDTSEYKHITKKTAQEFLLGHYLKLVAENFSDEVFLKVHNVEDFNSENSFDRKRALDNVNSLRQELIQVLKKDGITDNKIAVDFVSVRHDKNTIEPENIDTILGSNLKITNLSNYTNIGKENAGLLDEGMSALFILEDYDHERRVFRYDINGPISGCSTAYYALLLDFNLPNILSTVYGDIYAELGSMDMGFSGDCSFKVNDPDIANKIEAARVEEKIAITGTNYYTLLVKPTKTIDSYNPYEAEKTNELYGLMDAYEAHIRIIQEDGSLSEPLASNFIVSQSIEKL